MKPLSSANVGFSEDMESWLPSVGRKGVETTLLVPVLSLQEPPLQQDGGGDHRIMEQLSLEKIFEVIEYNE